METSKYGTRISGMTTGTNRYLVLSFMMLELFRTSYCDAQFRWSTREIDDGAKPAVAIDGVDNVHIAYMLEASPGFVKHAEINPDNSITIELVDEGYFYGPLDIAVGLDDLPHI